MYHVTYNDPNKGVRTFADVPGVLLRVGLNEVEDEDWEAIEAAAKPKNGKEGNVAIAHLLASGVLTARKVGDGEADTLAHMKPADAIETVRKTYNAALVGRWLANEKRKPVAQVMREQIAACTPPARVESDEQVAE